jgi:hypothetical protein
MVGTTQNVMRKKYPDLSKCLVTTQPQNHEDAKARKDLKNDFQIFVNLRTLVPL